MNPTSGDAMVKILGTRVAGELIRRSCDIGEFSDRIRLCWHCGNCGHVALEVIVKIVRLYEGEMLLEFPLSNPEFCRKMLHDRFESDCDNFNDGAMITTIEQDFQVWVPLKPRSPRK